LADNGRVRLRGDHTGTHRKGLVTQLKGIFLLRVECGCRHTRKEEKDKCPFLRRLSFRYESGFTSQGRAAPLRRKPKRTKRVAKEGKNVALFYALFGTNKAKDQELTDTRRPATSNEIP